MATPAIVREHQGKTARPNPARRDNDVVGHGDSPLYRPNVSRTPTLFVRWFLSRFWRGPELYSKSG